MSKPIIIWTFRRTGGTNLGRFLFEHSDFKSVEHEPFNINRIYGSVHKSWLEDRDESSLRDKIDAILAKKVNIKHCLEVIPSRFNEILLKSTIEAGYRHLFLYRNRPEDRLLSLNFAKKTDVWGKNQINPDYSNMDYSSPVEVDKLLNHEYLCQKNMRSIFEKLIEKDIYPLSISFEMLYKNEFRIASQYVKDIVQGLEINTDSLTTQVLEDLLVGGAQGTKKEYLKFPRSKELVEKANELPDFVLNEYPDSIPSFEILSDEVEHFEIWNNLPSVYYGFCHLHGVCLLNENSQTYTLLCSDSEAFDVVKYLSLPSGRVANLYPDNKLSSNSRFFTIATNAKQIEIKNSEKLIIVTNP